MPIINSSDMSPELQSRYSRSIYNALDCAVTFEVFEKIRPLQGNADLVSYKFAKALQAPILEIMDRGFRIDDYERRIGIAKLTEEITFLQSLLNDYACAVWGKGLNPQSPKQLIDFFYRSMKLPEIWISQKGVKKLSTNREALEKLDVYFHARPIISCILAIRDRKKQLSVLETEVSPDGRMRTSYNIGGTECIGGSSILWTQSGLRTIKEVYESPYEVKVWNGARFVAPARKVKYENRKGYYITVEGGYELFCSENHPIKTSFGTFVEAKDLKPYHHIEVNVGLRELFGRHNLPRGMYFELMSEDFCQFYGMILADGTLNVNDEHKRCRLANHKAEVQIEFKALVKSLFQLDCSQSEGELSFSSVPVSKFLAKLGFIHDKGLGSASWKTIPSELLRGKPNLLRALLRGLTLDSHITEKGIMYGTQSEVMQNQIQQCLLVLGILSHKLQMGNSIKLNIPRAYCGRFISLIGFVEEEKLVKLAKLLNQRCQWHEPKPFGQKAYLKIVKIEDWTGDVYDLTMPEDSPPQYVANGMTVHNTGRLSSSAAADGTGTNLQNLAPQLRKMFIADEGWKLCGMDLEQAESREVGWQCGILFDDWSYLDACYSGDLHTLTCRLIWPQLPWTGDPKKDRAIADQNFYREYSRRDMSKRGGHGSNYLGTPWTMARHLKVPVSLMEHFQKSYFEAFPGIPKWHRWTAQQLQTTHELTTPFGRTRTFFSRHNDDSTLREAVAYVPQSSTADRTNLILYRIWKHFGSRVQLLAQVHDAIYFQFHAHEEQEIIPEALSLFNIEMTHKGHSLVVPGEAKLGWNWGNYDERKNPDGLRKFKLGTPDDRERTPLLSRAL